LLLAHSLANTSEDYPGLPPVFHVETVKNLNDQHDQAHGLGRKSLTSSPSTLYTADRGALLNELYIASAASSRYCDSLLIASSDQRLRHSQAALKPHPGEEPLLSGAPGTAFYAADGRLGLALSGHTKEMLGCAGDMSDSAKFMLAGWNSLKTSRTHIHTYIHTYTYLYSQTRKPNAAKFMLAGQPVLLLDTLCPISYPPPCAPNSRSLTQSPVGR
jgi:hypothetical protein